MPHASQTSLCAAALFAVAPFGAHAQELPADGSPLPNGVTTDTVCAEENWDLVKPQQSCWIEIENLPGCHVWTGYWSPSAPVVPLWSGDCADGAESCGNGSVSTGGTTVPTGLGTDVDIEALGPGEGDGPLSRLVIYFDFDRTEVRSDFNDMLRAHGEFLANNEIRNVRLEGHADERGSGEYNIGLGNDQALAVQRVLMLQGASRDQLTATSYGEERPAAFGSDESSYSLNRRIELVYR